VINRIVDFSAKHRAAVIAAVAAAAVCGWWSMQHVALDAIPDVGETQVIVVSHWDRSPDVIEAQVTYPIVTALLGGPRIKAVRGLSDFGQSYVYVVFEEGTDVYWARSRTLEYLSSIAAKLPAGVTPEIGPDASGLGWVFQYVLVDDTGTHGLDELRSLQDWYLRYHLKSVPGVAEVATVGGYGKQYQIDVDPIRLRTYGIPLRRVVDAVRTGNADAGGRVVAFGGTEYMVRARGYARSVQDFEAIVLAAADGTPIRIRDVARVGLGPEPRRGVVDVDGRGDAVSGIVIMRDGENALTLVNRVRDTLAQIAPGLPAGVRVEAVYDRSDLIRRAIGTLSTTLVEIALVVAFVILLFLWHVPSALIPIITIPVTALITFVPFRGLGLTANIMSLGGMAIAIGAMVDASIVVVEQAHKKLEDRIGTPGAGDVRAVVLGAVKEVAPTAFFALLVLAVSFLPVLTLQAEEGRLFRPLAYTKSLSLLVAALLAITLDPALRVTLTRGRIQSESRHPVSRLLIRVYQPIALWALRWKWAVIGGAAVLMVATVPVALQLGAEFMPPLEEGALLYMPSTMPGISIAEAQRLLQLTDRTIAAFPEVDRVLGKAGRADTATDPAPLSMLETLITLKPVSQWPRIPTWYSAWAPEWLSTILRHVTPDHRSTADLVAALDNAVKLPGLSNAWSAPVRGRLDMLTTGVRTPIGLKISGADVAEIERIGTRLEPIVGAVAGARRVFAERPGHGYYVDVIWNREALARYGIDIDSANDVVEHAIGGGTVAVTIEGRGRYSVNVRYARDFRSDLGALGRITVPTGDGRGQVPIADVAQLTTTNGPAMLRDENGLLTGYVYVDLAGRDPAGFIAEADALLKGQTGLLPPGYSLSWSGQYEAIARMKDRLLVVLPLTVALIALLLYASTRSAAKTAIVLLAVPFSAVGAVWFLYLAGYHVSVAVWVGLIALVGVDAETGMFMLLYLDLAFEQARQDGRLRNIADLREAILHGAVKRLRPKVMTVSAMALGLVPVMWSTGTGADVMKRIAAPIVGGLFTSFVLELIVYPAIYEAWRSTTLFAKSKAEVKYVGVGEAAVVQTSMR
jgi:Cu(I)/Ag(I) efflux system membrane protein CusA/SilA